MMFWFEIVFTANKVRPRRSHNTDDILYKHQYPESCSAISLTPQPFYGWELPEFIAFSFIYASEAGQPLGSYLSNYRLKESW